MSGVASFRMDPGSMCYVGCQEAFDWFNASVHWCQKGCDYAKGRVNHPILRKEAENMCKMVAAESYHLESWEDLDNIKDYRIHAFMYPENATNLYKACLAGIRRQMY